ncbi:MAG: hypothetical protein HYT87_03895 [Nitrospirae bacterium]|nr:hypothetical protein [Nitrospirota bacterium]
MEQPNQLGNTGAYAPCPCGSGKKVKFCCGLKEDVDPEKPASASAQVESKRPPASPTRGKSGPSDAFIGYRHGRRKV